MVSRDAVPEVGSSLRATLNGWGVPGPIEERAGRRLLRLVDPASDEGRRLLRGGGVELIGPEGESFGAIDLDEACARLRRRLESCLGAPGPDPSSGAATPGRRRLAGS